MPERPEGSERLPRPEMRFEMGEDMEPLAQEALNTVEGFITNPLGPPTFQLARIYTFLTAWMVQNMVSKLSGSLDAQQGCVRSVRGLRMWQSSRRMWDPAPGPLGTLGYIRSLLYPLAPLCLPSPSVYRLCHITWTDPQTTRASNR